jgi:di/tricarboxylate transporter
MRRLKLYSDVPRQRTRQVASDIVVVLLLLLFVWVGTVVHDTVASLGVLATGVKEAGQTVEGGFTSVADAVSQVPVVGEAIGSAIAGAGDGTGGNLADLGQSGEDAVNRLATILGWATALLPILVLLAAAVPRRVRRVRHMSVAAAALVDLHDPERRRLLAMRAAFGLPYDELLAHTPDPLGDLAAGRHDALVRAALADVGLVDRHATPA